MQKVLIVSYEFPPILGGAAFFARDLAAALGQNSTDVFVATYKFKDYKPENFDDKVKILDFTPYKYLHFLQFLFLCYRTLNKHDFDLIIFSDNRAKKTAAFLQLIVAKKNIQNSVSVIHGSEKETFFTNPTFFQKITFSKYLINKLFRNQKRIINVSNTEFVKWKEFMPCLKLLKIYNGVDGHIFKPENELTRSIKRTELNMNNKFIVFTASRLVKGKGQDTILSALSLYLETGKNDIHLFIAGKGNYEDELKVISSKNGLDKHVTFLGKLSRQELVFYYQISDLFVLMSRMEESFGLVYAEALACMTPVIGVDAGGVKDIIVNDYNGYKIDGSGSGVLQARELYLKLCYLSDNPDVLTKLRENALVSFNNNYSSSLMASNYLNIIKV